MSVSIREPTLSDSCGWGLLYSGETVQARYVNKHDHLAPSPWRGFCVRAVLRRRFTLIPGEVWSGARERTGEASTGSRSGRPCPSTSPAAPEGLAAQECPAWKVGCPLPLDVGRSPVPKSRGASKVAGVRNPKSEKTSQRLRLRLGLTRWTTAAQQADGPGRLRTSESSPCRRTDRTSAPSTPRSCGLGLISLARNAGP